jgi:uncharacterized protein (TIGR02271 family)
MFDRNDVNRLHGATVRTVGGDKIGKVAQVYLDDQTGDPEWVTVRTGLFGTKESFMPLASARFKRNELVADVTKEQVNGAPRVDEDGHLSEPQEAEIYRYYGISPGTGQYATGRDRAGGRARGRDAGGRARGRDAGGRTTDDAMTRSEERLRAGTRRVEAGRARLRKYVVTDTEQVQVPVSREEVRLEREPVTEANRDAAYSGPAISEDEHEVTLHAERPVVETEAVPVERVRLGKETITDTETVSGEVRKEQVEVDNPTSTRSRRKR